MTRIRQLRLSQHWLGISTLSWMCATAISVQGGEPVAVATTGSATHVVLSPLQQAYPDLGCPDGSCEPSFRGGCCDDRGLSLWKGYCWERPSGFPISPRRTFDAIHRLGGHPGCPPCVAKGCESHHHSGSTGGVSTPVPVPANVPQGNGGTSTGAGAPTAAPAPPAQPTAPPAAAPQTRHEAPTQRATTLPVTQEPSLVRPEVETESPDLADPPLPKNVVPTEDAPAEQPPVADPALDAEETNEVPAQLLPANPLPTNDLPAEPPVPEVPSNPIPENPVPTNPTPSAESLRMPPEPRGLQITPASGKMHRGSARLLRQLKATR